MVLKGLTTRDNDLLVTVGIVVVHSEKIEVKDTYSDIPLRGTHCLGDSGIEFAFTGGRWM